MGADNATSIVLPAYVPNADLLGVTIACVASLEATTAPDSYELVIVDNGSIPDAAAMLHDAADRYLRFDIPLGYARAANIGLAVAEHDWLVVVNTDIEFQRSGWLGQLQADYLETPGGILSAMDDGREGLVYDESWFSCWLTHRDVIRRVGYFDESLGYRYHDQDYAIKVKRAGYEVMRDGNVPVSHINSATYDTMGRDEDPGERAVMEERWGASLFAKWLQTPA